MQIMQVALVVGLLGGTVTGCKKNNEKVEVKMQATVGQAGFKTDRCDAYFERLTLVIHGYPSGNMSPVPYPAAALRIPNYSRARRTYSMGGADSATGLYYASPTAVNAIKGSVTIIWDSLLNPIDGLKGKFNFTTTNGLVITGGTFTTDVPEQ